MILRDICLNFTYVDYQEPSYVEKAIRKNTRLVCIETQTNPLMRIIDITRISKITRKAHALLVVDNTFMSPYLQNPLSHGADIVVHSTTKYLGGHSDLRSEEHTSELQSHSDLVCRLLLEKKK